MQLSGGYQRLINAAHLGFAKTLLSLANKQTGARAKLPQLVFWPGH